MKTLPTPKRPSGFKVSIGLKMSLLILLALLAPRWARAATSSFSYADGRFNPSDWTLTIAWEFYPGTSAASFQHYLEDGNPGDFGSVSLRSVAPNAVAVLWRESYDPAVEGEILSITSTADLRLLRNSGQDRFLPYRPLISQNGHFFYGNWAMGVDNANWMPFAYGSQVLTQSRFIGLGEAAGFRPDFSAHGAPIQLGFMVDSGTRFSPRDSELGVDNWRMTITSVPEPGLEALTLLTLAVCALNRRRPPGQCPNKR